MSSSDYVELAPGEPAGAPSSATAPSQQPQHAHPHHSHPHQGGSSRSDVPHDHVGAGPGRRDIVRDARPAAKQHGHPPAARSRSPKTTTEVTRALTEALLPGAARHKI